MIVSNKETIFLTGGSGLIGRHVVKGLHNHGFRVISFDRAEPHERIEGVKYVIGDINDFNFLMDHMEGADYVVHLAALPNPSRGSSREIMRINVQGTFNTLQAAVKKGAKKIVQASSINYLGVSFGVKRFVPLYFPVDEEHPSCISDSYSLSKKICEEIAEYFWNRDGMTVFSLRFPNVFNEEAMLQRTTHRERAEPVITYLEGLSREERCKYISDIFEADKTEHFQYKSPEEIANASEEVKTEWSRAQTIMRTRRGLNVYINVSDCAYCIIKCIESNAKGAFPLFVHAPDNDLGIETARLANAFFPEVSLFKRNLTGTEPLISTARAKEIINFDLKK